MRDPLCQSVNNILRIAENINQVRGERELMEIDRLEGLECSKKFGALICLFVAGETSRDVLRVVGAKEYSNSSPCAPFTVLCAGTVCIDYERVGGNLEFRTDGVIVQASAFFACFLLWWPGIWIWASSTE